MRLRLTDQASTGAPSFGPAFDETLAARLRETDEFYRSVTPPSVSPDAANVMRQAVAGMLWSKQHYSFDAHRWLEERHAHPLQPGSRPSRNQDWFHMINDDIISMPDKWEYPWYAAWDLAFHTLPISIVDPDFAKQQMELILRGLYLHPSGQIPAYEWNFSDVNPPVHAWATLFLHRTEQALRGEADLDFLKSAFKKLLLNFTWWVNRKDRFGKNVFASWARWPPAGRTSRRRRWPSSWRRRRAGSRSRMPAARSSPCCWWPGPRAWARTGWASADSTRSRPCSTSPPATTVFAILPFGYPARAVGKGKKQRKPLRQVAHLERYGRPFE